MSKTVQATIGIGRTPEQVFDCVSDETRLPEWQPDVQVAQAEPPGLPAVGMRGHEVRKVPGGKRTITWEVTECERGRRWALRVLDGPVRAKVAMSFATAGEGASTAVSYGIWFQGHGIGPAISILARQGASRDQGRNLALLKQRLEETDPAAGLDATSGA